LLKLCSPRPCLPRLCLQIDRFLVRILPMIFVFVISVLVFSVWVGPVMAQNPLPGEMLDSARPKINSAVVSTAVAPSVPLPDSPTPQKARVIDKKFVAIMGALGGAESLRFTTHKLVLDYEFAAGAPWVTSVPPDRHLVVKYGGIYAAELLLVYELKKPHSWLPGDKVMRKIWWVYPAAMAPIHIKNGVRSIRTQAPSCPVAECEGQ
jgi:hypothetical protein